MQRTKLHWAFTILLSVLAVAGWALHWHVTVNNTKTVVPASTTTGSMTLAQCFALPHGMDMSTIQSEYGTPDISYASQDVLDYPLRNEHSNDINPDCQLTFNDGNHLIYRSISVP